MSDRTGLPDKGTDRNIWGMMLNDALRTGMIKQNILVAASSNNPPSVLTGTIFNVHGTKIDNIESTAATGNDVYPSGTTAVEYLAYDSIFEDADQTFAWGSGEFPARSDSTSWHLFCYATGVDSTTKGFGLYGASTAAFVWDEAKGGYYATITVDSTSVAVKGIAKFVVASSAVTNLTVFQNDDTIKSNVDPDFIAWRNGLSYFNTETNRVWNSLSTSSTSGWKKQAVYDSGTVDIGAGDTDVTVPLQWDWDGGYLTTIISNASTAWVAGAFAVAERHTSHDALTGAYTAKQVINHRVSGSGDYHTVNNKEDVSIGIPQAATSTSFTMHGSSDATAVFVKWYMWA